MRAIALPLAAGNTVILKGSELSPKCFWALGRIFVEAGLPKGCVNVLFHRTSDAAKITNSLIAHPAIWKLNFTGSTRVGHAIASVAGKFGKPMLLELGGKAPCIILDDADLQEAASGCLIGAFKGVSGYGTAQPTIVLNLCRPDKFVCQQNVLSSSDALPTLSEPSCVRKQRRCLSQLHPYRL